MSEAIIYIDQSEVREGRLEDLRAAVRDLAGLVEAEEPRLVAYHAYFSESGDRLTVLHVHRDRASLAHHMRVGGPVFPTLRDLINLLTIDLYGDPGDELVVQMRQKAQLLGTGTVRVHHLDAGFTRLGPD